MGRGVDTPNSVVEDGCTLTKIVAEDSGHPDVELVSQGGEARQQQTDFSTFTPLSWVQMQLPTSEHTIPVDPS